MIPEYLKNSNVPLHSVRECLVCGGTGKLQRLKPENVVDSHLNHGVVLTTSYNVCTSHINDFGLFKVGTVIPVNDDKSVMDCGMLFEDNIMDGIEPYNAAKLREMKALDDEIKDGSGGWDVFQMSDDRLFKLTLLTVCEVVCLCVWEGVCGKCVCEVCVWACMCGRVYVGGAHV